MNIVNYEKNTLIYNKSQVITNRNLRCSIYIHKKIKRCHLF